MTPFFLFSSNNQHKIPEEGKNRKSRKLDPGQDLTPDIVTWLPVLLTASNPTGSHQTGSQLKNEVRGPKDKTTEATASEAAAAKNKVDNENGQKTLEDGLVFRSPEMKRSLRRNKKKKLSKKSSRPRTASGSSSDASEASDSFCETLKRHRRKPNKK